MGRFMSIALFLYIRGAEEDEERRDGERGRYG